MNIKQRLKKTLAEYLGLSNVVLFSSCRNALYTLLKSLDLQEGDEVIVQSFICSTLPTAIQEAGGKPVLANVGEDTFNLDPKDLERKITSRTKAVLFVHTYGNPTGITEVVNICKKHKLILIEDIAQGLGASYDGKLAGTFGDYAVSSFTKQIINIGGGAVLSNHDLHKIEQLQFQLDRGKKPSLIEYPKRLITSLYEARAFFLSKILIDIARKKATNLKVALHLDPHFHCSSIEAYLALSQIHSLRKKIKQRKEHFHYIQKNVPTQNIADGAESSYLYLTFRFPDAETQKKALQNHFLFLSPWQGNLLSEKVIFVPNNPCFKRRHLDRLLAGYHKAFKGGIS